ncbi:tail fiber assembly protein [Citrobacter telavivensis]
MKPVFDENGLAIESGSVRCFYFCPLTGEFKGWSDEFINIGVSMPGYSTNLDPGEEVTGKVAVFKDGGWNQIEDNRGMVVYSTTDKTAITVDYIGPVHNGFTSTSPLTPYDTWNGSGWVTDSIVEHEANVVAAHVEKQFRITQANEFISNKQWPGKAVMDRLSDNEKTQYNVWLDYLEALEALDTSVAPNIMWPMIPAT